ncbi:hypothetical protein AB0H71_16550 [Nocardia sp. NPDC050697]|uniref:hypothetical protein n=1 Tax=Nocardia sp. NPDC050697 TaxID=3155158 RepID=UPI0033D8A9C3
MIQKLAASIREYCEEMLAQSTAGSSESPGGEDSSRKSHRSESTRANASAWSRWWKKLNRRLDRSARKIARSPKWAVFVGLLTVLAAVASIVAVIVRDSKAPAPGHTNVIYVAGSRFFDVPYESTPGEAFCGNSPATNRSDAYLCLVPGPDGATRIKLDPCFAVQQGAVACPSLGSEKKYTKWRAPAVELPEHNPVPPGAAPWPYEVILHDGTSCLSMTGILISAPEVNTYEMVFAVNEETPKNPIFRCGIQPSPIVAVDWIFSEDGLLKTVKWVEDPGYFKSQIGGLSMENGVYYGLYSSEPGASFEQVSLAAIVL